jgi:hypothetical protein
MTLMIGSDKDTPAWYALDGDFLFIDAPSGFLELMKT